VLANLRDRLPGARFKAITREHEAVAARFGLPAVPMLLSTRPGNRSGRPWRVLTLLAKVLDPFWLLWAIHDLDVVVVPGMGVLEEQIGVKPWGLPYALYSLGLACRLRGARLILLSVGAEPVKNPLTRRLMAGTVRQAAYCSYRDQYSLEAMFANGVSRADPVLPDVVLALPVERSTEVDPALVSVGVMSYFGPNDDRAAYAEFHRGYLDSLVAIVTDLMAAGRKVRLVIGDEVDEDVADQVAARCRTGSAGQVEVSAAKTIDELNAALRDSSLVIGTRYHNVLCGLRLAIPTVSLGYGEKNADLMADAGLADASQHITSFSADWVLAQCTALSRNHDEVVDRLLSFNADSEKRLAEQYDAVAELIVRVDQPIDVKA
jgi:polysaccharide pyruvyl transferase WcaK-like protein